MDVQVKLYKHGAISIIHFTAGSIEMLVYDLTYFMVNWKVFKVDF